MRGWVAQFFNKQQIFLLIWTLFVTILQLVVTDLAQILEFFMKAKSNKFVLIPRSAGQVIDLSSKRGIQVTRRNERGEVVVTMTPQRAGSLRRELQDVTVEAVIPVYPNQATRQIER
jgi:hypothetical protein